MLLFKMQVIHRHMEVMEEVMEGAMEEAMEAIPPRNSSSKVGSRQFSGLLFTRTHFPAWLQGVALEWVA